MLINKMLFLPSGEPQGKDGNQKIRDRCKQYLDRVEELKAYLVNKEVVIFVYKCGGKNSMMIIIT